MSESDLAIPLLVGGDVTPDFFRPYPRPEGSCFAETSKSSSANAVERSCGEIGGEKAAGIRFSGGEVGGYT